MPQKPPSHDSKKKQLNNYGRYLGMAMQMAAIIVLGTLGGRWLDGYFKTDTPWFTLGLALFSVFGAMWYFIKDFIKPKE